MGDDVMATQHLLLALATADPRTGALLTDAGADPAGLRQVLGANGRRRPGRPDQQEVLRTLGVDLAELRRRAHDTFGAEAVTRAARRSRPSGPRRPLWSWISCSKPLPRRRCDSPLTGQALGLIPRVTRLLQRASRTARPGLASPEHLLLTLLNGKEPACELLHAMGVDVAGLTVAVHRAIDSAGPPA